MNSSKQWVSFYFAPCKWILINRIVEQYIKSASEQIRGTQNLKNILYTFGTLVKWTAQKFSLNFVRGIGTNRPSLTKNKYYLRICRIFFTWDDVRYAGTATCNHGSLEVFNRQILHSLWLRLLFIPYYYIMAYCFRTDFPQQSLITFTFGYHY